MTPGPYAAIDTHSARALRARLDRITRYDPRSREDLVHLEGIILGASLCHDAQLEFDARTQWMATSSMHVRSREVRRENLRWCLRHIEEHPDGVGELAFVRTLRAITRLIDESAGDPESPLSEIDGLLRIFHDVRIRAGLGGHSEQELRMQIALELGDAPEALYRQGLAEDEIPDALSSCTGCAAMDAVHLEEAIGRFAHAAAIATAVLGDLRRGCRIQPYALQAASLFSLSLTGRHDAALAHAETAWPGLLESGFHHGLAGRLLRWCAWSRQTRCALELLEEYLPVLADNPRPESERLRFLTGAAVVARRAAEELGPDTPLAGSCVGVLARCWSQEVRELAARFDRRNGSDVISQDVEASLTAPVWDGTTLPTSPPRRPAGLRDGSGAHDARRHGRLLGRLRRHRD